MMLPVTGPWQSVWSYKQSTVCSCLCWAWVCTPRLCVYTSTCLGGQHNSLGIQIHFHLLPSVGYLLRLVTERVSGCTHVACETFIMSRLIVMSDVHQTDTSSNSVPVLRSLACGLTAMQWVLSHLCSEAGSQGVIPGEAG